MAEKIRCPHCSRLNEIGKFCIHCGGKLFKSDDEFRLASASPQPYCLNCGRQALEGQAICGCGYEFADIACPYCEAENPYANRFCSSCGRKLWRSDVYGYTYPERIFERHTILVESLPYALHNTSLFRRHKAEVARYEAYDIAKKDGNSEDNLKREDLKTDRYLREICSRWQVVSPRHCIKCLSILKTTVGQVYEFVCPKCGTSHLGDERLVRYLQGDKNRYVRHEFDRPELKWTSKYSESYMLSLAPAVGESQFEYRERLKWEFAENLYRKKNIKTAIDLLNAPEPVRKASEEKEVHWEWDLYGVTQDMWEMKQMEDMRQRRQDPEDRFKR